MKTHRINTRRLALFVSLMLLCIAPGTRAAERELHWEALDVEAHLDAGGVLDVIERHTMVFTGDWNGGEREFNVRPRQKLEFLGLGRIDANTGSLLPLQETSVPNNVDEFTWTNSRTLRWRSRLPSDPPFDKTRLTYILHYKLSGIVLKNDGEYRIEHDFAFPKRPGPIERFTLSLDLDPAWQPLGEFRNQYSAGPLDTGQSFVVKIPLRYSGSGAAAAVDVGRPAAIVAAVMAILAVFALMVLAFVVREHSLGRFAPVDATGIDTAWIQTNILGYPAELVGAAWDGRIGTSEVVALIARMTAEGKLESEIEAKDSMRLRLKVGRDKLNEYERALVEGLFFDQRTETSTKEVQQHYKRSGFDPVNLIRPKLNEQVRKVLPPGNARVGHLGNLALFLAGVVLLVWTAYSEPASIGASVAIAIVSLILSAILQIPGWLFKSRVDWGLQAAALLLLPALFVSLGAALFLWFYAGTGEVELPWTMIGALTALTLYVANASISGMKSRQSSEAIAFRKRLAAGRRFFLKELDKPQPNLRDGWYPWLLAFGLARQVDFWSTRHGATRTNASTWDPSTSPSSSSSSSHTGWSGGGGLSGGAGASGTWAAAAAGMAAGIAAPSSSSSGGSSSSSGGGSSGGGGGGGW